MGASLLHAELHSIEMCKTYSFKIEAKVYYGRTIIYNLTVYPNDLYFFRNTPRHMGHILGRFESNT